MLIFLIYGLITGSFVATVIIRYLRNESLLTRSHCDHCGYQLKVYDLIPIISFVIYRGKCRKCNSRISLFHPIIEIINSIIFLAVYFKYGFTNYSYLLCVIFSLLLAVSFIDYLIFEIPNTFISLILLISSIHLFLINDFLDYILGSLCISIPLLLIFIATRQKGIGGGDVKLFFALGLFFGTEKTIMIFILSCLLALIIHPVLMLLMKKDKILAFGPYISTATLIVCFFYKELLFIYWSYISFY